MQGMERGQRIAIPLREKRTPSGQLRILLQDDGQLEIHYAVDEDNACSTRPCGEATVGVDKGYTEAYTDSDGERHGKGLGDLLAAESDARKVKGQRRNRMRDLEQKHRDAGNVQKADRILRHNLGHRKWDRRQKQHNARVRDFLCQAAHSVVDRAGTIACEDLTAPMQSAKVMHRDTQRRLSGWVKGVMADTLISISRRRGTALVLVNPAYTSQIDSRTGLLQESGVGTGFTARTESCWTRTPTPPAISWRACTTTRSRCTRPSERSNDCSGIEAGQRWGRLHPDSSPHRRRKPPDGRERITPNLMGLGNC